MATATQTVPTFSDLKFGPRPGIGGIQVRLTFDNGFGASVIQGAGSYGNEAGLYEIAVLHNDRLDYDTPITDDVLGYLSEDAVTETLAQIAALPARVQS